MERKYKVTVNENEDFSFAPQEIEDLDIQSHSSNDFHILKDHVSFKASLVTKDFLKKTYKVKINSNVYEVKIANELDLLIEDMGLNLNDNVVIGDLYAPMPGNILEVLVQEGDEVEEGQYVLVLEAMKMENTLTAPKAGKIKAVHYTKGANVEKNALLLEIE